MPKINLLYVITKLELGGAQKQLLSLINNLNREKFNTFLFTGQEGLLLSQAQAHPGLTIKRSRFLVRPLNPLFDFIALWELSRFIKKNQIEVVHTHSSKAGIIGRWAARLSAVKLIIHTVHGWPYNNYQFFLRRRFFIWLERIAASFTDILIVVSRYDENSGLANRIGRKEQYRLIRYGIEKHDLPFDINNTRKQLGIADTDLLLVMVACFKPQKAPGDFIKLASLVTQIRPALKVKFVLIGDGVLRKHLKQLISGSGLKNKVVLAGWRRDVLEILSASDLFVLTSLWEGLAIAVLEAMSLGRATVVTDTGGICEVIQDGKNGFLVKPGDVETMAERVISLLENESLRQETGLRARQSLGREFVTEYMVGATQDLYLSFRKQDLTFYAN